MKLTPNRMTLIKLSTAGLGLLAVMIGIQVRSNEDPTQTALQEASQEAPLQVQPVAKVPQEQGRDSPAPLIPPPVTSTEVPPETQVAPTRVLSVQPLEADASEETKPTEQPVSTASPEPNSGRDLESEVLGTTESSKVIETLIRPNQSVGPVTPTTTRADLVARFGEDVLEDIAVHVGEGFTEAGTRVNLGADQSFSVIWNSQTGQARQVRDFGSAWKTPEGVGLGTSLKELEAIAGPFELFGFGWDYGGTVMLSSSAPIAHDGLILRVHPKSDEIDLAQPNSPQTQAYQAVLGDAQFSSQHESFDILEAFVYDMIVSFQDL